MRNMISIWHTMQNTFFFSRGFLLVFQVVVLCAAGDVLWHVLAFIYLPFLPFQCFLYSGMVLITVLLCVAGLCGSTKRPLTRSHWLICSFNLSLCHSSVFLIYIHSHPITPPLPRLISFHTFSLFLLSLFSLTTPSTYIYLTLTGIYCSCILCLFWACITVVNLSMRATWSGMSFVTLII